LLLDSLGQLIFGYEFMIEEDLSSFLFEPWATERLLPRSWGRSVYPKKANIFPASPLLFSFSGPGPIFAARKKGMTEGRSGEGDNFIRGIKSSGAPLSSKA